MKKIGLIIAILFSISFSVFAQNSGPVIQFKEKDNTHNFGNLRQGVPVTYEFVFTNTGDKPLVIMKVDVSCGCTNPEWPKTPIAPGKSGKIKVTYDAASVGAFNKSIYIKSNAINVKKNERFELKIKGEVLKK